MNLKNTKFNESWLIKHNCTESQFKILFEWYIFDDADYDDILEYIKLNNINITEEELSEIRESPIPHKNKKSRFKFWQRNKRHLDATLAFNTEDNGDLKEFLKGVEWADENPNGFIHDKGLVTVK